MTQQLTQLKCEPCRGDTPPFTQEEIAVYLPQVSGEWQVVDDTKLRRIFTWRGFLRSMLFVNALAYLAEQEGHHPDMHISYNRVTVELTTHAIGGLSRNDFILAAKIDQLVAAHADGAP
ncbi:MAG: 4a-hydroxytetrahydrobiopterin dehydratase [Chloroflexi bacterium]|nr:4a-hydroxytetrahydrobiopterin dehydratase [Chloroflexota bacterium]